MDLVMIEKLQAMKRYQRRSHFLPYCLSLVSLVFLLSSPLWLPLVCSSIKHLFTVFLSKMAAIILGPKFLFIVSNVIVIFLVRESKSSPSSPPTPEVYEEYVEQSKTNFKQQITNEEEVKEDKIGGESHSVEKSNNKNGSPSDEMIINKKDEAVKEDEEEMGDGMEEGEMRAECEELGGEDEAEEDKGLPADELNRRVEDFIARMNSQRMVEARMMVCYV